MRVANHYNLQPGLGLYRKNNLKHIVQEYNKIQWGFPNKIVSFLHNQHEPNYKRKDLILSKSKMESSNENITSCSSKCLAYIKSKLLRQWDILDVPQLTILDSSMQKL